MPSSKGDAVAVHALSLVRWTVLCAAAEAVGMTATATAAKASQTLVGEPVSEPVLVEPAAVDVLLRGRWEHRKGILLHPGEPGYDTAIRAYRQRWPRIDIPQDGVLVQVRLAGHLTAGARTPPSPPAAG